MEGRQLFHRWGCCVNDLIKPKAANLYALLGVTPEATDEEIKNAYYALAKAYHPDQRTGDPQGDEAFSAITRAAEILRDPERRKLYDRGDIDEAGAVTPSAKKRRLRASEYRAFAIAFFAAFFVTTALGVFMIKESEETVASKTPAIVADQVISAMANHEDERSSSILPAAPKIVENFTPPSADERRDLPLDRQVPSVPPPPIKAPGNGQHREAIAPTQTLDSPVMPNTKRQAPQEPGKQAPERQANKSEPERELAEGNVGVSVDAFPLSQRKPEKPAPFVGDPPAASRAMVQDSSEHWQKKQEAKSSPAHILVAKQQPRSLLKALVDMGSCIRAANLDNWPRKCRLTPACRANKAWCSC